jgi:hypothetical protein
MREFSVPRTCRGNGHEASGRCKSAGVEDLLNERPEARGAGRGEVRLVGIELLAVDIDQTRIAGTVEAVKRHRCRRADEEREARELRWVPFTGQFQPLTSLSSGGRNKVPIVAAISLNAAGHPIHAKVSPIAGVTSEALPGWAMQQLSSSCSVLSDRLACLRSVVAAGCSQIAVVTGGRHPNTPPEFRWINILLGNLQTSFSGTFHAFDFGIDAKRYLGGF